VALDSRGADAARPFIKPDATEYPRFVYELMGWDPDASRVSTPAYPCLIDEYHKVAELYGTVNVPAAVWIDENGGMVRSPDNAGACDAFRTMDRTTFKMQKESAAQAREVRISYIAALRDWIENGAASKHVLQDSEPGQHWPTSKDQAGAARFRLGLELSRMGRDQEARAQFTEAERLSPDNWSYKRQAWDLEQPGKAAGPEFWAAVDALGDKRYYPPSPFSGER